MNVNLLAEGTPSTPGRWWCCGLIKSGPLAPSPPSQDLTAHTVSITSTRTHISEPRHPHRVFTVSSRQDQRFVLNTATLTAITRTVNSNNSAVGILDSECG